ncbi:MAG: PD40 domain-containing protein [Planctomycetes bacterium]|nr:PD40 domain-containing protein [Planctomycetota bacterium]
MYTSNLAPLSALIVLVAAPAVARPQGVSHLLSVDFNGTHAVGGNGAPVLSGDGRYVAFSSAANDIVPGDTNGTWDVFVRDLQTGTTIQASLSETGAPFSGESRNPALSADGRFIVFSTLPKRIYIRDLALGINENVNVSTSGTTGNGDGQTDFAYAVTPDGRFVAFASLASNLVAGDTNNKADVFVRDRQANTTERVSVSSLGEQGLDYSVKTAISDDGRFVAFESYADNLVPNDANDWADVFVRDRWLSTTARVSVNANGVQAHLGAARPSLSSDGRWIAFESASSNLVPGDGNGMNDVYVRDLQSGAIELVSRAKNGVAAGGFGPALSYDGRFVAFVSDSDALVFDDHNGHADVFVFDRATGSTYMAGRSASGDQGNGDAAEVALSGDGRWLAFDTFASNLAASDTNGIRDYFAHELGAVIPQRYCQAKLNSQNCTPSIAHSGSASSSSSSPFLLQAHSVLNQKTGYLFYGLGASSTPFLGGTMCVAFPLRRTPGQSSGGTASPAVDCSGVLAFELNAWIQAGVDPALIAGGVVNAQFAYRDPGDAFKLGLTDALQFVISN